jgi:hypothetical protein
MDDRDFLTRSLSRLSAAFLPSSCSRRMPILSLLLALFAARAQESAANPQEALPEAPAPQKMVETQHPQHHPVIDYTSNGTPGGIPLVPCPHHTIPLREERFTTGTEAQHLTVRDKARMAERDLTDPYDAASVAADSSISIATSPTSRYGTGAMAYGKSVGVGLAQDSSSEVTNTFLIPSLTHQDPQYHREPGASKMHRIEHAFADVAWTESDSGKGIPNYSNLIGSHWPTSTCRGSGEARSRPRNDTAPAWASRLSTTWLPNSLPTLPATFISSRLSGRTSSTKWLGWPQTAGQ